MSSGYVSNEYVSDMHYYIAPRPDLGFIIVYEPLRNKGVISISGAIYDDERDRPVGYFQGSEGVIMPLVARHLSETNLLMGRFDKDTGIICLTWKKHPSRHFLYVSYDYSGVAEPQKVNWLKEGF